MPTPNQRDEDLIDRVNRLTTELVELQANVISRWGRIPHVAADPASPPDGAMWMRSDLSQLRYRANGGTIGTVVILNDSAQAIATGAAADITWGTETNDPDNWTSGGSATLTVPTGQGGRKIISYNGIFAGPAGTLQGSTLLHNGIRVATSFDANLWNAPSFCCLRTITAGDTLKVQVFQNSGAPVNIDSRLEISSI